MNDVADILQTRGSPSPPAPSNVDSKQTASSGSKLKKKPRGLSREVFALASADSTAAAALQEVAESDQVPKGVRKFTIDPSKRTRPWQWAGFQNSARTDGVRLKHWMRKPIVIDEYPFERFNKPVYVVSYTDQIYEEALKSETWTKQETDLLVQFCRRFALKWPIIADRWPNETSVRNVVDLRERYWSIAKTLVSTYTEEQMLGGRPVDPKMAKLTADARSAIKSFAFDGQLEREKLSSLDLQFKLSKQEEAQIAHWQAQLHQLESDLRKHRAERKKLEEKIKQDVKRKKKMKRKAVEPVQPVEGDTSLISSAKKPRVATEVTVDQLDEALASIERPNKDVCLRSEMCAPLRLPGTIGKIDIDPPLSSNQAKSLASLLSGRGIDEVSVNSEKVWRALTDYRQDAIRLIVYESGAKRLKNELRLLKQGK